jgi:ADP-heptose:LPS heptosyltransferase
LKHFKKLSAAKLWGLQVEPRPDLGTEAFYTDLAPSIRNMVDTAHYLHNLDLLICCDTSIAHLAGAIGTPCWLILPYMPDWRWGLDSEKTGWYNSLRLFRQSTPGDWEEVFERVSKALEGFNET